jgi:cobyrinic acid a,c-diamide synthase
MYRRFPESPDSALPRAKGSVSPGESKTLRRHHSPAPRFVVAGLSGDSGKTLFSLGLLLLARRRGIPAAAFKKGPDYIDAAWLSWASGGKVRNLDTYLMGEETVMQSFRRHALLGGLNLIEGNRGLYDGFDVLGTYSTAELAKLLDAPVLLVVNAAKVTRTVAALVLGCQKLDPRVRIGGVILNRVCGTRHEAVLKQSLESACGVPVLGTLPAVKGASVLPGRHLGLVTPEEHGKLGKLAARLLNLVEDRLDLDRILELGASTPPIATPTPVTQKSEESRGLRIGFLKDSAFTFYYPENLEALDNSGAELIPISALSASLIPDGLDALYIGGGFPETHASALSRNYGLLASLRSRALEGFPIYAECGGLMLLAQAIRWRGARFAMAGVFPFDVEVHAAPQGHGYVEMRVDRCNSYYPVGTVIRGHEFHYSEVIPTTPLPETACAVERGTGTFKGRDAVLAKNVWASYAHVHALATPQWAAGLLAAARRWSASRSASEHHLPSGGEEKSPCLVR